MAEGVNRLDLPVVEEQLFQVKKKNQNSILLWKRSEYSMTLTHFGSVLT